MDRSEFEALHPLDAQPDLNASLAKWCRINLSPPLTPREDIHATPIFQGTLWNVGFVPDDQTLDAMNVNWAALHEAVEFIHGIAEELSDNDCIYSSVSDCAYYPFICLESLRADHLAEDLLRALRTPVALTNEWDSHYRRVWPRGSFLGLDMALDTVAFLEPVESVDDLDEEQREELADYISNDEIQVYQSVKGRLGELRGLQTLAILGGFDSFPSLTLGQHQSGYWVGLLIFESDRDAYSAD